MYRIALALAVLCSLFIAVPVSAGVTIITGEDLGRPYQIIESYPAVIYQQFADFSIKGDPLQNAVVKGLKKLRIVAEQHGADAVIGTRIEFANRTSKDEGRVLLYGTLVKFK